MAVKIELDTKAVGTHIRVPCKECRRDTNHVVLASVDENGSEPMDPYNDFQWCTTSQLICCQGCDTFRSGTFTSNSEGDEFETLYPSRTEGRKVLSDVRLLPDDLERIYRETVGSLNAALPVLTGIGIRAIIETVTKEKKASGNDLSAKIDGLVALGVLTPPGAEILHKCHRSHRI